MFSKQLAAVRGEVSGARALAYVGEIIRHHRIQASPGYRAAAEWANSAFAAAGLEHRIISYLSDGHVSYWTSASFEEWACEGATLDLVAPAGEARRLCDYDEVKISVIQRSCATPPGGVEAEVVVVDEPERAESYASVDVRGKYVLVRGDLERIRQLAVVQGGAVGIIADTMWEFPPIRTRMDVPDARQYSSFWWGAPGEDRCFGFVLSPRQGEWLRGLIRRGAADGKPVRLRGEVKSSYYGGAIEDVEAVLRGTGSGEVLVVAHLCHPQWSANDNASGCAAAIEAARTLEKLVQSGVLPRPARSIRFLLVPEMTGTYAFLAGNENLIPGIAAAINLDMVGENQEICGSSMLVEKPPRALGSFAGDVAALVLEAMAQEVPNLAKTDAYALFRHSVTPFSGGSDHYILSDPTVGVPCPMLIQWPDKYYHTSEDTLDKVDPKSLARAAVLTATYAYFLAAAGQDEVIWLAGEMAGLYGTEAARVARRAAGGPQAPKTRAMLEFARDRKCADIDSLRRLLPCTPSPAAEAALAAAKQRVAALTEGVWEHAERTIAVAKSASAAAPGTASQQAQLDPLPAVPAGWETCPVDPASRPRRTFRGPLGQRSLAAGLDAASREAWLHESTAYAKALGKDPGVVRGLVTVAMYWTDGVRTLNEINSMVEMEYGMSDLTLLGKIFELLARQGHIVWD
jgi:hypothetical protein